MGMVTWFLNLQVIAEYGQDLDITARHVSGHNYDILASFSTMEVNKVTSSIFFTVYGTYSFLPTSASLSILTWRGQFIFFHVTCLSSFLQFVSAIKD